MSNKILYVSEKRMRDLNFLFVEFSHFLFFITPNFPLHIKSITVFIYILIVGCRKSDIRLSACSYSNVGKLLTFESVIENPTFDSALARIRMSESDSRLSRLSKIRHSTRRLLVFECQKATPAWVGCRKIRHSITSKSRLELNRILFCT